MESTYVCNVAGPKVEPLACPTMFETPAPNTDAVPTINSLGSVRPLACPQMFSKKRGPAAPQPTNNSSQVVPPLASPTLFPS